MRYPGLSRPPPDDDDDDDTPFATGLLINTRLEPSLDPLGRLTVAIVYVPPTIREIDFAFDANDWDTTVINASSSMDYPRPNPFMARDPGSNLK